MPCLNVREGDGLVSIIQLDECGAPALSASTGLLRLTTISEFGFEDTVEEGDSINERNFGGRKCYTDVGQDEITSVAINMTVCGINPALDSLLTGSQLYTAGNGFGRKDLAANTNVAIQVLMRLDTDSCDGGGDAKIAALGLRIRNGCSYHGLSLNVDMDLSPFAAINPCGYAGLRVTQTSELGIPLNLAEAGELLCRHLRQQLDRQHG